MSRQFDFGESAAANRFLQLVQSFKGGVSHHREARARKMRIINVGNIPGSRFSTPWNRNRQLHISTFLNRGKQLFALFAANDGARCQ